MPARTLRFISLSDGDRQQVDRLPRLKDADAVAVHVRRRAGDEQTVSLPASAVELIEIILSHLARGVRVAVLPEDREVTPNEAAQILGISRPLVVHRMAIGDLPFRYVGRHRRMRLADVLAFRAKLDEQRTDLRALAEDSDELAREYGV